MLISLGLLQPTAQKVKLNGLFGSWTNTKYFFVYNSQSTSVSFCNTYKTEEPLNWFGKQIGHFCSREMVLIWGGNMLVSLPVVWDGHLRWWEICFQRQTFVFNCSAEQFSELKVVLTFLSKTVQQVTEKIRSRNPNILTTGWAKSCNFLKIL